MPTSFLAGRRARVAVVATVLAAVAATFAAPSAEAVVNGTRVAEGERSFMAALLSDGSQFCGGSVIAPQLVMTAAHCVSDGSAEGLSVSVGSTDWTAGTEIPVTEVIVHPDYDQAPSADVAVLRLAAPAPVEPIALAGPGDDGLEAAGRPAVVSGWGSQTPFIGQVPPLDNALYEVELTVVADDDFQCGTDSPADQVCASDLLEDSCQGDSGGPLFADLPGGEVQIGIVSSGLGCAVPFFAGLYTEVNGPRIASFLAGVLQG
jgi:trypsin